MNPGEPADDFKLRTWTFTVVCLTVTLCVHAQSSEATQLMEATNEDRAQHGLGPLRWDPALAHAAQAHADEWCGTGNSRTSTRANPDW